MERALLDDELQAADLPEAWNEKYQQYLGITPPDNRSGVLQDVHWSAGLIGYFPTYSLGNLYAAQFFAKAEADLGNLAESFARGDFRPLLRVAAREGAPPRSAVLGGGIGGAGDRPAAVGPAVGRASYGENGGVVRNVDLGTGTDAAKLEWAGLQPVDVDSFGDAVKRLVPPIDAHDFHVPEMPEAGVDSAGVDSTALVRCPLCNAEYALSEALALAPPELIPVALAGCATGGGRGCAAGDGSGGDGRSSRGNRSSDSEAENEAAAVAERFPAMPVAARRAAKTKSALQTLIEVVSAGWQVAWWPTTGWHSITAPSFAPRACRNSPCRASRGSRLRGPPRQRRQGEAGREEAGQRQAQGRESSSESATSKLLLSEGKTSYSLE